MGKGTVMESNTLSHLLSRLEEYIHRLLIPGQCPHSFGGLSGYDP